MEQKNVIFRRWFSRFLILFSFIGVGFWLLAGSTGSFLSSLQGDASRVYAKEPSRPRPEIDLQVPATTETALFALG